MKKFLIMISVFGWFYSFSQTPADDPSWQLVWFDDFSNTNINIVNPLAPDPNKWNVLDNFDNYVGINNPSYNGGVSLSSNVAVAGGNLIITTNHNSWTCPITHLLQVNIC